VVSSILLGFWHGVANPYEAIAVVSINSSKIVTLNPETTWYCTGIELYIYAIITKNVFIENSIEG
jgi:hypothetical protein